MKPISSPLKSVTYEELGVVLSQLITEKGAETYLGSMGTTQGIFILFFSHRYNEEYSLVVKSMDTPKVLARVFETLAEKREMDS